MTLKLSDWANIAEVVSGIAVVVTLLFLIAGIQENTEMTRVTAFDRNLERIDQIAVSIAQDPELSRVWQVYAEGEMSDLTDAERFRVQLMVRSLFRIYDSAYNAYRYENLGFTEWTRFQAQICEHLERVGPDWSEISPALTEGFSDYVVESCETEE